MKRALIAAMFLIATPAMAQSTLVLPEPDGGYVLIPPSGPITQILREPGGGHLILSPGITSTIILPEPSQFDDFGPAPFSTPDSHTAWKPRKLAEPDSDFCRESGFVERSSCTCIIRDPGARAYGGC
jgi:hypothetical protein